MTSVRHRASSSYLQLAALDLLDGLLLCFDTTAPRRPVDDGDADTAGAWSSDVVHVILEVFRIRLDKEIYKHWSRFPWFRRQYKHSNDTNRWQHFARQPSGRCGS